MTRDYDREAQDAADHKYAYDFDFDVMHRYMMRAFSPFFISGNALELGSFQGAFTRRLTDRFSDVTCVEASGEAIAVAREKIGDAATFVHALLRTCLCPRGMTTSSSPMSLNTWMILLEFFGGSTKSGSLMPDVFFWSVRTPMRPHDRLQ